MPQTYTVKQVAEILGYSTNSIYTFLKEKRIKGVRVGRGRFRIPQTELNRLLAISKQPKEILPQAVVSNPIAQAPVPPVSLPLLSGETPSLFSWFLVMASILLGFSMFLFGSTFDEFGIVPFLPWFFPLRISFIAGAIGLLVAQMFGKPMQKWQTIFASILLTAYVSYTVILWTLGDGDGVALYGLFSLVVLYQIAAAPAGIFSFLVYTALLALVLPIVLLVEPNSILGIIAAAFPYAKPVMIAVWTVLFFGGIFTVWKGYKRHWIAITIGIFCMSILLVVVSATYAKGLYWSRSLFFLLMAIILLFAPIWHTHIFTARRNRGRLIMAGGFLLLLLLAATGAIRLVQTTMIDYAKTELANKATYGKIVIDASVETLQTSIESASKNSLLLTAIEHAEKDTVIGISRSLFEGNRMIKTVQVLSPDGSLIARYPYDDTSAGVLLTKEDSAAVTKGEKQLHIPDTAIIALPVTNRQATVSAIIAGSLNMDMLGSTLQQIASPDQREYFSVVNKNGIRIFHPNTTLVGTTVFPDHPIRSALAGSTGTGEEQINGVRTVFAYIPVEKTGWGLQVNAPLTAVLRFTNAATIAIFAIAVFCGVMTAVLIVSTQKKVTIPENNGP